MYVYNKFQYFFYVPLKKQFLVAVFQSFTDIKYVIGL